MSNFTWPDYLVFVIVILISASIGFVIGWLDRKKSSAKDFLLGGGNLRTLPVGISILASFTSAVAILGFSAEMYLYGTMYWMVTLSYPFTQCFAALVYIPFFHRLKLTTAYEYLKIRFNDYVHLAASAIFCFQMFFYMSVALYTPALAIEQVTGIDLEISIVVTGAICSVYTVIGGMKGTVWIDTFQVGIMFIGLIVVIIQGSASVEGGFSEIWRRAADSGRIEFFDFNPNPLRRHTFWTVFVGAFFTNLTVYAANQGTIQRYLSVKKWQKAAEALMVNLIGGVLLLTLTCLTGIVAYGKYYDCDLIGSKKIAKGEQLLPYLVMDVLGNLPGLPGLFVATIYSAALSTISAGMNSLAAVCITDFVRPAYKHFKKKPIDEKIAGRVTRALALGFGAAAIGFAIVIQFLGNTVLQLALSIFGLLGGPLLGVISVGIFLPFVNWVGALVGLLLSTVINLWLGIGGILLRKPILRKPLTTAGCAKTTIDALTTLMSTAAQTTKAPASNTTTIYDISYFYYSIVAVIIVFVCAIVVSPIVDKFNLIKKKQLNPDCYIHYSFLKRRNQVSSMIDSTDIKPTNYVDDDLDKDKSERRKSITNENQQPVEETNL